MHLKCTSWNVLKICVSIKSIITNFLKNAQKTLCHLFLFRKRPRKFLWNFPRSKNKRWTINKPNMKWNDQPDDPNKLEAFYFIDSSTGSAICFNHKKSEWLDPNENQKDLRKSNEFTSRRNSHTIEIKIRTENVQRLLDNM